MTRYEAALEQVKHAFTVFNKSAPSICKIDWDAAWDAMSADELCDLRDELQDMFAALSA
jgi:hypothetical protein